MQYFFKFVGSLLLYILALNGILFIILKGYDYYLIKKEIRSRRGIGSFASDKEWSEAVKGICCRWVVKMPKVQISDNTVFVLLEKIAGKYSTEELQAWQQGGLLLGLAQYMKKYPYEADIGSILKEVIGNLFNQNNDWKNEPKVIDYALLSYAIMKLPIYDEHYRRAMEKIIDIIKEHIGVDGTVCYRKQIPNYRLVDTVGMICPFLIRFGNLYEKPELIDLGIKQIEKYTLYGVSSKTGIPAHAYHTDSKMPLGIYGWGRGVGWYALGLIDSYEELQPDHIKIEYLKTHIIMLAEALVKYQRHDGGWGHSLLIDHNIHDSSVTAISVYFLRKAVLNDIVKGDLYIEAIERGTAKLKQSTRRNGTVDFSQGDTKGIGVYSTVFREFPFTQGMVLGAINIS